MPLLFAPALAATEQRRAPAPPSASLRSLGSFTPAVSDPRLAAMLARRGTSIGEFRFTPATPAPDRNRAVRVAIRSTSPNEAVRSASVVAPGSPGMAIAPSSYNLGVSVGWRRFAVIGDMSQSRDYVMPGGRDTAEVGVTYRANRHLTGRVAVGAERAEGVQRMIAPDSAYSLDVGGSYSIAQNVDLTAGARYRVSRDRIEPLARDERRDSQAVYIGTAFRF